MMGVRIGGHLGPVSASTRVSGKGCLPALGAALLVGGLIVYWYVAVPVAAIALLSILAVRYRNKRRAAQELERRRLERARYEQRQANLRAATATARYVPNREPSPNGVAGRVDLTARRTPRTAGGGYEWMQRR
jgi:hypothetical protein